MDPILVDAFVTSFIALFVIVDPIGIAPVFASLTQGTDKPHKRLMAIRGTVVGSLILLFFAWVGQPFLEGLGISLDALRVAGGILLFVISFEMVMERRTERKQDTADEIHEFFEDVSVFPIALPLTAGPGAIATIILLMTRYEGNLAAQGMVIAGLGLTMALTLATFLMASKLMEFLGPTVNTVLTRVLGIILAALAAQYVLSGLQGTFLPAAAVAG